MGNGNVGLISGHGVHRLVSHYTTKEGPNHSGGFFPSTHQQGP